MSNYTNEEWRTIPLFPEYVASNMGRIRRIKHAQTWNAGVILRPSVTYQGYHVVSIHSNHKRCQQKVHRLVLMAFSGVPSVGIQGNHLNGNKGDNRLVNLEWETPQGNTQHAQRTGLRRSQEGLNNNAASLTAETIQQIINLRASGMSCRAIGKQLGVGGWTVSRLMRGITYKGVLT